MSDAARTANMQREKKAVALSSIFAAVGITAMKVVVGITTGSLGILSEAAHSGLDLVAAAVTYASVRVSDKPADAEHQYGHGKIESFSAFVETGLLLLTCVWIVYEAARRLFFHSVDIEPTLWAFVVMGISIVVDTWRSRKLNTIAQRYDSQALQADALHFSTDVWSSTVVILGLALVMVGRHYHLPWLAKADPIAALFVACIVVYVSSRLALRTVDTLLDAAPAGVRSRIIETVRRVDGVLEVERVRIRRSGSKYFADVGIAMSRNVTFQKSEQVANDVSGHIRELLPDADVVVNAVARASHQESLFDQIRAVATRNNLNVHDISVQDVSGKLHVEQHVELDERLSLKQAHDRVSRLEAEMKYEIREISNIVTHIESEPATIETSEGLLRVGAHHHAGRPAALPRARHPDRRRRTLPPGSSRTLPRADPSGTRHR
jgi:cation diffusion facilitator family transporter